MDVFVEVGKEAGHRMTVAEIREAIRSISTEKSVEANAFRLGLQEALSEQLHAA